MLLEVFHDDYIFQAQCKTGVTCNQRPQQESNWDCCGYLGHLDKSDMKETHCATEQNTIFFDVI